MYYSKEFKIGKRLISKNSPTYFIADIAANHDGKLSRALDLINLAKESGANCAKFQHFKASKIVSDYGFKGKMGNVSHQKNWEKSVFEIYDEYHSPDEWTDSLIKECKKVDIDFMTTPYDIEAVKNFKNIVPAFKIGSGDITFEKILQEIAYCQIPVFLATGASNIYEVKRAMNTILNINSQVCIMQCNTNYTGDLENFKYVNLKALKTFENIWPNIPMGLSDHTPGHTAVLGAVTLGATVIEKHFTDDNNRVGPDHSFALNPLTWKEMVCATRDLENSIGDGIKEIESNEKETMVIQRRAVRLKIDCKKGTILDESLLDFLRPCPKEALTPYETTKIIGKKLTKDCVKGECINWEIIE